MAQTENVTTKFKVDISDLKKNITEANKQIKLANAEFKNATAGMDKWSESADGLTAKIAQQNKIVDAEKSKLDALKAQLDRLNKSQENGEKIIKDLTAKYETATKEFGETSDEAKKYAKQLKEAQEAQERNTKAADNLTIQIINQDTAVKKAESQIDKYTKQLDDMQREMSEDAKTVDNTTNSIDKMNDETDNVNKSTNNAVRGGISAFSVALGNLAANALTACVNKLKELVTASVGVGETFDSSMSKVQAISGATADEMINLEEKARKMGETTKFTATEAGDAFGYMAMAGWKTEDMLNGIDGIMNLAAASGADLATTSDIVTDALTAFGAGAEDAGHLANVMAVASANANTNVEMMGETFKYAAPVAGALGASMEDTATAIGLMANAGIKSSQAGTALRAGLSSMVKPSRQAATYMDKYNIELQKNADGTVNLGATIQDLRDKMDGVSESEQAAAASAIFGKNAMSGWLAIINASDEDFTKLTNAINDSDNAAAEMSATMMDNLGGDITLMKSALEGLGLTIYDRFRAPLRETVQTIANELIPAIKDLINGDGSKLESFIDKTVTKGFGVINKALPKIADMITKAVPKITNVLAKVAKVLAGAIKKLLPTIIKTIGDIAPDVINTVMSIIVQLASALIASAPELVKTILSIASDLLTTIAAELPTIVDGIVTVIPELVQALTDPETMSQIFNATIQLMMAMVDAVPTIINALIPQIPVIVDNVSKILIENAPIIAQASYEMFVGILSAIPQVIAELIPALGDIGESIKTNFIDPISEKFSQLWEKIKTVFAPAVKWFSDLWGDVKKTAASILSSIEQKFKNAYSTIKSAFSGAGQFFAGVWTEIKNNFATVGTFFSEKFSAAYEKIKSAFSGIGEFFGGIWDTISGMFTEIGTKAGDAIGGAFKDAMNSVIETVENAINAIPDAINNMLDEINKLPGVDIPSIPSVSLPRLAKGGIIDKSTLAQIGEQGQEAVIPLERNKAGLKKIAGLLAEEMGVNVSGNGKIVGGNVYNFHQTNNSPKALSRYDIYRQTKNMIRSLELAGV